MASILDRYGIKEVADVTFYRIGDDGQPKEPVLYLDTLKVSTIEQTAESVDARGGKGNPKLVTWDYGKEITVTLEDALFSAKSMNISLGNGAATVAMDSASVWVDRTALVRTKSGSSSLPDYFIADVYDATEEGAVRKRIYMSGTPEAGGVAYGDVSANFKVIGIYPEEGRTAIVPETETDGVYTAVTTASWAGASAPASDQKVFVKYQYKAIRKIITISGDKFPGTYYVTGDTYARSDVTGKDQLFQFIIPKAKLSAEQTITLEAEGDPSVFNMNLTVLRPEDGDMMKLVQYDLKAT